LRDLAYEANLRKSAVCEGTVSVSGNGNSAETDRKDVRRQRPKLNVTGNDPKPVSPTHLNPFYNSEIAISDGGSIPEFYPHSTLI
jgi:hypothetical protein